MGRMGLMTSLLVVTVGVDEEDWMWLVITLGVDEEDWLEKLGVDEEEEEEEEEGEEEEVVV